MNGTQKKQLFIIAIGKNGGNVLAALKEHGGALALINTCCFWEEFRRFLTLL